MYQDVVACVDTADGVARDGHGFGCADVFVGEYANTDSTQGDCVCAQRGDCCNATQGGGSNSVIYFVHRRHAGDGEIRSGDVACHASRLYQDVVARIDTADGVARDGHGFADADVLVGEDACTACQGNGIGTQDRDRCTAQGGGSISVIHFGRHCHTVDGEIRSGDVACHASRLYQDVVARVDSADGVARDGHGFADADIFVSEHTNTDAAQSDDIPNQRCNRCGARQSGRRGGGINFVRRSHPGDGKVGCGDGQCAGIRIAEGVSHPIYYCARRTNGVDADILARCSAESREGCNDACGITINQPTQGISKRGVRTGTVIYLAGADGRDGQGRLNPEIQPVA